VSCTVRSRRKIIALSDIKEKYDLNECFRSWNRYTYDIRDYQQTNRGSLKGYKGKCVADFLPIDIDNKDLDNSLKSSRKIIDTLRNKYIIPVEALILYFTGAKGFHIEIPISFFGDISPSVEFPKICKAVAVSLTQENIDTTIYHTNALWRLSNSINQKGGRYKIPITYDELCHLSIDNIKEKARMSAALPDWISFNECKEINILCDLWQDTSKSNRDSTTINTTKTSIQKNIEPTNIAKYSRKINRWTYQHEGVKEGHRNNTAFRIARELYSAGDKYENILDYIINEWNMKNIPPERDIKSLENTIRSACNYDKCDAGTIFITRHLRIDAFYNSLNNTEKIIYIDFLINLNEVEKLVWGKYLCKPNQRIFSYKSIAKKLDMGIQKVRTFIDKLIENKIAVVETLSNGQRVECSRITFLNLNIIKCNTLTNIQFVDDNHVRTNTPINIY